jgi:hypothetical protein
MSQQATSAACIPYSAQNARKKYQDNLFSAYGVANKMKVHYAGLRLSSVRVEASERDSANIKLEN